MTSNDTHWRRVLTIAVVATVIASLTVVGGVGGTADPAIVVETADGGSTVAVALSAAPTGLSGFEVSVSVDQSGATITGVEYGGSFGLTEDPVYSDDASSVTVRAVDLPESVDPGASDVSFVTIELDGQVAGAGSVDVTINQLDDDDGNPIVVTGAENAHVDDGSGSSGDDGSGSNDGEDSDTSEGEDPDSNGGDDPGDGDAPGDGSSGTDGTADGDGSDDTVSSGDTPGTGDGVNPSQGDTSGSSDDGSEAGESNEQESEEAAASTDGGGPSPPSVDALLAVLWMVGSVFVLFLVVVGARFTVRWV